MTSTYRHSPPPNSTGLKMPELTSSAPLECADEPLLDLGNQFVARPKKTILSMPEFDYTCDANAQQQQFRPRIPGLPTDSKARKEFPTCTGVLDYFTAAIAEVAHVSWVGNQKHNPGEPLHHARGKSMDHPDCIVRHTMERGGWDKFEWIDEDGIAQVRWVMHSAYVAWRALADLQQECEDLGAPRARAAR